MLEIVNFFMNYILGFIILISALVFIHEMGHYLFAKLFKVKVEAFSIGFGKELFGWTDKSGTRWKVCPIPFGGYVKMKGEMIESNADAESNNDPDAFNSKALWQKFLIVFAGPLFNLVFPIIVLLFIGFFVGIPNYSSKIDKVLDNSPAFNILKSGDEIIKIDNTKIKTFADLQTIVTQNPHQKFNFTVKRDNQELVLPITIGANKINKMEVGFLGISATNKVLNNSKYSLEHSISYTYNTYMKVLSLITYGFKQLFIGNVTLDDIGGPIKIAQISGDSLKDGIPSWLFFMAMLSLNLAIINLFPIPALDGGHLLLYIIQGITRKKLSLKVQSFIMQCGFTFLLLLMALVILKDVWSLF